MNTGLTEQYPACLDALLTGSQHAGREFIIDGVTHADVLAMAAGLYRTTREINGPVCLCSDRRQVLAAALLASLMGGPPLLLPPSLAAHTLFRMHRESNFSTILTDADKKPDLPANVRIIRADSLPTRAAEPNPATPDSIDPDRKLLYIYTGGSTGRPKIWAKTAGNIFGEALYLARHFGITEQDRILATMPPLHIYGLLFSVLLPLVTGAGVAADTPAFPGDIAKSVKKRRITILAAVPPHYRVLRGVDLHNSSLRLAVSSAGPLAEKDSLTFYRNSGIGVVEVFGSTETGGIGTRNRALNEEIFTPFAPVDLQSRDNRLTVRSPFLSPDLPRTKDGFFISADRVEMRSGGFLPMGRTDTIAKVGGKRVDLEEIREQICRITGVEECVVLSLTDPGGRGEVIGALIQGTADLKKVKAMLTDRLEPHARPKILRHTDRIPIRANGKYDRPAILKLLQQ